MVTASLTTPPTATATADSVAILKYIFRGNPVAQLAAFSLEKGSKVGQPTTYYSVRPPNGLICYSAACMHADTYRYVKKVQE